MKNKSALRKQKLLERNLISLKDRERAEERISSLFFNTISNMELSKISVYFSLKKEAPTNKIREYLVSSNIDCFLPVISEDLNQRKMNFSKLEESTSLKKNSFNIFEPVEDKLIQTDELDLILIPLVAFDEEGFRLGMGKGYYDHTLNDAELKRTPILVGIAFDSQKVETCFPEAHDLKMDLLISPSKVYRF
jgi:5-formyltetrahydrofolate cyclo-ligase